MKTSQEKYHEDQTNVEDDEEGYGMIDSIKVYRQYRKHHDESRRIREVTSPRSIAKMKSL